MPLNPFESLSALKPPRETAPLSKGDIRREAGLGDSPPFEFSPEDDERLKNYLREAISAKKSGDLKSAISALKAYKQDFLKTKARLTRAESSPELSAIIEHEQQKLREFFGRDIEVPPLPEGITVEQIKAWEAQHLKLHYLPLIDMSKEDIEGWIKPDFKYLTESDLPKDAMLLPGSWLLVDERPKPRYESGNQQYENDEDFLGPVLEELRQKGLIQSFEHPGSRFNISPQELENPAVIEAVARAYNLKPEQITLPRMIEFNVLGNIHHPDWGKTDCSEWFSDQYKAGLRRLDGGDSVDGGLAYVYSYVPGRRGVIIGFRALGRFS